MNNADNGPGTFVGGLIIGLLCALTGTLIAHRATLDIMRDSAIEAGVAEWTIDSKTGQSEFKWKGNKNESNK